MPMLTVAQAAERLGVNTSRVRQLILGGRIKATKFGSAWQIAESALNAVAERPPGRPRTRAPRRRRGT